MKTKICSFCGSPESADNPIISGDGAAICKNCVQAAYKMVTDEGQFTLKINAIETNFSPKALKKILDTYVIGQEAAKKTFAVAVYNHYNSLSAHDHNGIRRP